MEGDGNGIVPSIVEQNKNKPVFEVFMHIHFINCYYLCYYSHIF